MHIKAQRVYLALRVATSLFMSIVFTASGVFAVINAQLSPLQLVLLGTALEGTIFVFEVPTGVLADTWSRKCSILIGLVLIGCGFVLWGSFNRFMPMLIAQMLWGLGYTFANGATDAWIADEIGTERAGILYLHAAQLSQIGSLVGMGLGILIGSFYVARAIVTGGIGMLALALATAVSMPETRFQLGRNSSAVSGPRSMGQTLRASLCIVRGRSMLIMIFTIGAFLGMASEGYDRLNSAHLLRDFGHPFKMVQPVVWLGALGVMSMVLNFAAVQAASRCVDTASHRSVSRAMLLIDSFLIASMLLFALAGNLGAAIGYQWLIGMARTIRSPLDSAWVNQYVVSEVRATVLSMRSQMDALGQLLGGPLVGWIGNVISIRAALALTAIALTPVLFVYVAVLRQEQANEK